MGLGRNIIEKLGSVELGRTLQIFIRNRENKVVGGITSYIFGGWVYSSVLWVEESLRNKGNGTKLLRMMENEAVRLGCKCAHVDTYSFEAKPFYEKTGILFATLEKLSQRTQKALSQEEPVTTMQSRCLQDGSGEYVVGRERFVFMHPSS